MIEFIPRSSDCIINQILADLAVKLSAVVGNKVLSEHISFLFHRWNIV